MGEEKTTILRSIFKKSQEESLSYQILRYPTKPLIQYGFGTETNKQIKQWNTIETLETDWCIYENWYL